jgi:butyrate kinase
VWTTPVARVSDLVEVAGSMRPKTVIIPGGHREDDLLLVESARDHGIVANCLLVGDAERIRCSTERLGIGVADEHIIATQSPKETAARTVELVHQGKADIILKGDISTPILNAAMLKLRVRKTMGLVTMFDAAPDRQRPADVHYRPRGDDRVHLRPARGPDRKRDRCGPRRGRSRAAARGLLSANEKVIPSLKSSVVADRLTKRNWKDAIVYGPLSFDLATDMSSVESKGIPEGGLAHEVAGKADILVCPGIDTANSVYKVIMAMVKYGEASMAGVTVGRAGALRHPVARRSVGDTSRFDRPLLRVFGANAGEARRWCSGGRGQQAPCPAPSWRSTRDRRPPRWPYFVTATACVNTSWPTTPARWRRTTWRAKSSAAATSWRSSCAPGRSGRSTPWSGAADSCSGRRASCPGGTYLVAEPEGDTVRVEQDIVDGVTRHAEMDHASNLGIPMATRFARQLRVPAYAVDPVVVDEFSAEAELSGYAPITRKSTSHALSIRAALHRYASESGRETEEINIVVGHLGGGITIAAVRDGRMVDNSIALLGEGPFTPQRTGTLPLKELIDLCYDGQYTKAGLLAELTKRGGLVSYLGDHRVEQLQEAAEAGDEKVQRVFDAMAYQIAKEVGAMSVAVGIGLEAIVLTGGLVRSKAMLKNIRGRVGSLAPVVVYRESLEMEAMARGVLRVIEGKEEPKKYTL